MTDSLCRTPVTNTTNTVNQLYSNKNYNNQTSLVVQCTQGSVCALQESVSLVLCKFWRLYGGVNGDLLGFCHTQVCCPQSPCPRGSPLPTCTSTGDIQKQFCLSLCGVSGSWCTQGLFEPSEHLWQEWGLILNVIWLLLPSCWGFSFAFECGVSPHSCSSAYRLTGVSLTLDVGYLHTASPAKHSSCSRPWTSAIYSRLLQWSTGTSPDLGRRVSPHGCCSWPWTW